MVENSPALGRLGRDHHPQAFTMWVAGGGLNRGLTYGATDELGFHVVGQPVHVHDLQATILHLLGFDHERVIFRHAGRDFRPMFTGTWFDPDAADMPMKREWCEPKRGDRSGPGCRATPQGMSCISRRCHCDAETLADRP
jgi:hypothetical protein